MTNHETAVPARDRLFALIASIPGSGTVDWCSPARALLDEIAAVSVPPPAPRADDRAAVAAPVKQRADCTELEWAEQERARFERLYTRETVRADLAEQRAETAARDAEIYQKRLERLGEGYTEQRKRAEEAEARAAAMEHAMESTAADALKHRGCHRDLMAQCLRAERAEAEVERMRTDRAAVCICGHTEQQHFEDVCITEVTGCDCGDFLTGEAAREVIARWRDAATRMANDADLPGRLEAALTERFTELGNPFSAMRRQEQGPDGWPASHPVGPHHVAEVLRELLDGGPCVAGEQQNETPEATPCDVPNGCEDGDLCATHEEEQAHAEGEHAFCGVTCEVAMPTELMRNSLIAWAPPGGKGILAELERRAAAVPAVVAQPGKEPAAGVRQDRAQQ